MAYIGFGKIGRIFNGGAVANPILLSKGSAAAPSLGFDGFPGNGFFRLFDENRIDVAINSNRVQTWDTSNFITFVPVVINNEAYLTSDGAHILALKNDNNDQKFRTYGANGSYFQIASQSELLTIAAAASTPTVMQVPIYATVQGAAVYVETVIPTAATFTVTLTTQGTTLNNAAVSTAQGSSDLGNNNCPVKSTSAQTITITPNLQPAAATGKVRVILMYTIPSPPTS